MRKVPVANEERDNEVVSQHLPARLTFYSIETSTYINSLHFQRYTPLKNTTILLVKRLIMVPQKEKGLIMHNQLCNLILVDLTSLTLCSPSHPQENLQPKEIYNCLS